MPNIKVKQLDSRIATQGVHFGLGPATRKLEPGEIVYMDEDTPLFERIYATGAVEITTQKPTRPLTFDNAREARYCSPTFRPRDEFEVKEASTARALVAQRVENTERTRPGMLAAAKKAAEKRAESETVAEKTIADVKQDSVRKVDNRRATRRKQLEEEKRGETNTA